MMDGETYLASAKRDAIVAAALRGALQAMMLTHGAKITMAAVSGTLNYEREMLELRDALLILGLDPDEPTIAPFSGSRAD